MQQSSNLLAAPAEMTENSTHCRWLNRNLIAETFDLSRLLDKYLSFNPYRLRFPECLCLVLWSCFYETFDLSWIRWVTNVTSFTYPGPLNSRQLHCMPVYSWGMIEWISSINQSTLGRLTVDWLIWHDNLVVACLFCNSTKSDFLLSVSRQKTGIGDKNHTPPSELENWW